MSNFKQFLAMSALTLAAALPMSGFAQTAMEPGKMDMSSQPATLTDGEVKKIDLDAGKITLKHGDIKHLDMPGMTMVFTAKDKAMLAAVKAGDKVKFMVVSEGGKMVLTELQPTK
jgi:Cu/Ag efflux protein CusF